MTTATRSDAWIDLCARLGPDAVSALAVQGFVAAELRASGRTTFKLRWRQAGRQWVVYLGSDPDLANKVRAELAAHQAARNARREFGRLLCRARRILARAKARMAPVLAGRGLFYHGYTARLRRPRRRATDTTPGSHERTKDE